MSYEILNYLWNWINKFFHNKIMNNQFKNTEKHMCVTKFKFFCLSKSKPLSPSSHVSTGAEHEQMACNRLFLLGDDWHSKSKYREKVKI